MARACFCVGLAAALLAGCPKSREDGGGGGDIPIEMLRAELAAAYCDLIFRCEFGGGDFANLELLFGTRAACEDYLESYAFAGGEIDALMRAVAEGTVAYDASAARECASSIGSGCSATVSGTELGDSASCDVVFTGTVPEGGSCWIHEECVAGFGCEFSGGTCPGTCTADGGFSCGADGMCPAEQECFRSETGTQRCVTEILEPDAAEGEPCGLVAETETEIRRRACRPELWCTGDSYTMGTCRAPIAGGQPCSSGDVCADGHLCVVGVCMEVTVARTEGAPCGESMVTVCDPFARLECVDGTCVETTDGASGSPCRTGDFGEVTCDVGLVCHGDTDTCGAPREAGEPCTLDRQCASGSCDGSTGTCRERYCAG